MTKGHRFLQVGVACLLLSIPLLALTVSAMARANESAATATDLSPSLYARGIEALLPYGGFGMLLFLAGVVAVCMGIFKTRRAIRHG